MYIKQNLLNDEMFVFVVLYIHIEVRKEIITLTVVSCSQYLRGYISEEFGVAFFEGTFRLEKVQARTISRFICNERQEHSCLIYGTLDKKILR